MTHYSRILVPEDMPILDALAVITRESSQAVVVVDQAGRLRGVMTDGDVRRGLLRGSQLHDPVHTVMNGRPRSLSVNARGFAREIMRRAAVQQIPIVDESGRVVDVEFLESPGIDPSHAIVVLMAGGMGTRLRPLTENLPKPMIQVGGRPVIETIVSRLVEQGFTRFVVTLNYMGNVIRDYFGDGHQLGAEISYTVERKRMGTAGALSLLPERPEGSLVVMNSDVLTAVDLRSLLAFHHDNRALGTMCVRDYTLQIPYGVVDADQTSFRGIIEKPSQTFHVNAGIYALEASVLDMIPSDEYFEMTTLFERIRDQGDAAAVFPIHEYWLDIGKHDDLERARTEWPGLERRRAA
ncbi:MAG: nucleotidyltransferase family protein [Rhodothermales bacterium]|nr:nucleotidyltransferase family protein [Rhodothermales bacterium]MBO6781064.1 nucleotidyltransferase family protein [Rhodothermales bacterium]